MAVLKDMISTVSTLGRCGSLEQMNLTVSSVRGCSGLERTKLNSFYFESVWWC